MKAVMYHYVRPTTEPPPFGYYHLGLKAFRRQLEYFTDRFEPMDRAEFVDCVTGERDPPESSFVLTFDDGLRDHHEWVLPELERRDLWGVFFVPTGPLTSGKLLPVHRIHALLGAVDPHLLFETLIEITDGDLADSKADRGDRTTAESAAAFKRVLTSGIPRSRVEPVLDDLEGRFERAGGIDAEEYYMSDRQLRSLRSSGMMVGAHSVSHPVLARLPESEQREEVFESVEFVESIGTDPETTLFAYPYGGRDTFSRTTEDLVEEAGCAAAFSTVSGDLTGEHLTGSRFALPRRDCNEFPHGQATVDFR